LPSEAVIACAAIAMTSRTQPVPAGVSSSVASFVKAVSAVPGRAAQAVCNAIVWLLASSGPPSETVDETDGGQYHRGDNESDRDIDEG
jgi:hypothetical protein